MKCISPQPRTLLGEKGITLIEVMIAMTLGLLILGAMTTIFVNNSQSRREIDKAAQQLENGRYAMQILQDEISLAGYYDTLASIAAGAVSADPCSTTIANWSGTMAVAVEGINAGAFACITTARPNTGMIFAQRASTALATGALAADIPYLQVSLCGDEYAVTGTRFKLGTTSAPLNLKGLDCGATTAPVRQYLRRIFFIDRNNVAGDGIPTLKRVDHTNGGALGNAEALVEGIEDLHFEYGIDADGNGTPETYAEAPAAADIPNIVGVRVWLLARALTTSPGYTDNKTYQLGTKAAYEPQDGYRRHLFNSYVELTHPVGRRSK